MIKIFRKNNAYLKLLRLLFLSLPFAMPFLFTTIASSDLILIKIPKIMDFDINACKYINFIQKKEKDENRIEEFEMLNKSKNLSILYKDEENKKLKRLLKYKENINAKNIFISTRILTNIENITTNTIAVPVGEKDGIKKNYIAFNENGLVGIIDKVFDLSSTIILASNKKIYLPVTIHGKKKINAIFNGGKSMLSFVDEDNIKYINIDNEVFLLENNSNKQTGIKIGSISKITNNDIKIKLANDRSVTGFIVIAN